MPTNQKTHAQVQDATIFTKPKMSRKLAKDSMVAVCSWCKKIRTPEGEWLTLEAFIHRYFGAICTHTICEGCRDQHYPECHP
jgi:hypothetical protein